MEIILILAWFLAYGPVAAALVIGLFWAALAHPERIRNRTEFRLSALCLGSSLLTAVLIPVVLTVHFSTETGVPRRPLQSAVLYMCGTGPVLLMLAIVLGVDSVMAKRPQSDA